MKDSDTDTKKSPALQKILSHPALRREQEEDGDKAYDEARIRSRDSYMVEFRFASGRKAAFSWAGMPEIDFDPEEGFETITLRFASAKVIVNGQALGELYEKLLDQRTRFIQEGTGSDQDSRKRHGPLVERIEIERKED
jgi:hypothetical protein